MVLSVARETSYGGLQWGLYTPLKNAFGVGSDSDGGYGAPCHSLLLTLPRGLRMLFHVFTCLPRALDFARKLSSGLAAGALASVVITPVDLVCTPRTHHTRPHTHPQGRVCVCR